MILVSKCLAGFSCRYDGAQKCDAQIKRMVDAGEAVAVCPECMGGLPTPRPPAEIAGGDGADVLDIRAKVVNSMGEDVSDAFIRGAYEALRLARECGAREAVLKSRSPSCGAGMIYDGSFSSRLKEGDGVTAALFKRSGIKVHQR